MSVKDGGPAFPLPKGNENIDPTVAGMSLRDWFAGMALQGLIVRPIGVQVGCPLSMRAYELADAMLKERDDD